MGASIIGPRYIPAPQVPALRSLGEGGACPAGSEDGRINQFLKNFDAAGVEEGEIGKINRAACINVGAIAPIGRCTAIREPVVGYDTERFEIVGNNLYYVRTVKIHTVG